MSLALALRVLALTLPPETVGRWAGPQLTRDSSPEDGPLMASDAHDLQYVRRVREYDGAACNCLDCCVMVMVRIYLRTCRFVTFDSGLSVARELVNIREIVAYYSRLMFRSASVGPL